MESGFVGFDPVSGLKTDRFSFPNELLFPVSLYYSLPALLRADGHNSSGSDVTEYVVLRFLNLGRFIQVYGSLVKGSEIHNLSLDEHKFCPTLNLLRATSTNSDGFFNLNLETDVLEFWSIVKDGLALPLLIDLCSQTHLPVPPCFFLLPPELKLKILSSLSGTHIAIMECVCSEMRYLASDNDLWKRKFKQEFGVDWRFIGVSNNWKSLFRSSWEKKRSRVELTYRPTWTYSP